MTNWKYEDEEFKNILQRNNNLDDEKLSVRNTKTELIKHLKETACYSALNPTILIALKKATTFHTFNNALNDIYDYADNNKIWLGI